MATASSARVGHVLTYEIIKDRRATAVIGIAAAVVCTALGAYVRIPLWFTPVPVTGQTFFVLLSAAMLGGSLGGAAQASYLALGLVGVPLFAGMQGGIGILNGPTYGYLIGFVVAAFAIGWILSRSERPSLLRAAIAMLIGTAIIYVFGAAHLAFGLGLGLHVGLVQGVVPFLPGDAVKLAGALAIWRGSRDRVKTIFG